LDGTPASSPRAADSNPGVCGSDRNELPGGGTVGSVARIPDSVRAVLKGPALAHLVTLEPDGRPQVSIVWVGLDGDELVAAHLSEHRKLQNIRRDPRVAISMEAGTHNQRGLVEYIVIHGQARITEGGAAALLQQLARIYLGPDVKFPSVENPPPGYITHISVERVSGVGPWGR
jgi:PPOX class probable F420-dependent enzyme